MFLPPTFSHNTQVPEDGLLPEVGQEKVKQFSTSNKQHLLGGTGKMAPDHALRLIINKRRQYQQPHHRATPSPLRYTHTPQNHLSCVFSTGQKYPQGFVVRRSSHHSTQPHLLVNVDLKKREEDE